MSVRLLRRDSVPVDGAGRVALVDAALASVSRREFLTGKEAADVFRDLRTRLGNGGSEAVVDYLDAAVSEYDRDGLWGAPTIADALLDLRSLATAEQSAPSPPT